MKPVNLYFHIPFCKRRCSYCAFYTVKWDETIEEQYVYALIRDIDRYAEKLDSYLVSTIYFGGGTPSLLQPGLLEKIITHCRATLHLKPEIEITMEANPDSLTFEKLAGYKLAGINRISIGLQAWQDALLEYFGRLHDRSTFERAYHLAREAGFSNINVDLIFGIPYQTMDDWRESITSVVALDPEHISCYSLELDNNSKLGVMHKRGILKTPDEKLDRQMYRFARIYLKKHGYRQYEISNFCKNSYESQHNADFWHHQEFLGFGAGASSYFERIHFHQIEDVTKYITNNPEPVFERRDEPQALKYDELVLKLRLLDGLNLDDYANRFGSRFEVEYKKELTELVSHRLIQISPTRVWLTPKGLDLYNFVIRALAI